MVSSSNSANRPLLHERAIQVPKNGERGNVPILRSNESLQAAIIYYGSLPRDFNDPAKRRGVDPTPTAPLDLISIDTRKRTLPRPFTHGI